MTHDIGLWGMRITGVLLCIGVLLLIRRAIRIREHNGSAIREISHD